MLEKSSQRYKDCRLDLGVPTLDINIPYTLAWVMRNDPNAARLRRQVTDTHDSLVRSGATAGEVEQKITVLVNTISPPRNMTFFSKERSDFARAFFIVSRSQLNPRAIVTNVGVRVLRVLGGACLQRIKHYHYLVVTEFPVRIEAIVATRSTNVTVVGTDTLKCERYIRSQEDRGSGGIVDYIPEQALYTAHHYNWVNPICGTSFCDHGSRARVQYPFEGGTLPVVQRDNFYNMRIVRTALRTLPPSLPLPVSFVYMAERNAFTGNVEGELDNGVRPAYASHPCVRISRYAGLTDAQARQIVSQQFRQCLFLIIKT